MTSHRVLAVASLERRFCAAAADRALAWVPTAAVGLLTWTLVAAPWVIVVAMAATLLGLGTLLAIITGLTGTSPGRVLGGLRLLDVDTGQPIGVGRALCRAAILGLAGLPTFGLGLATLAWTATEDPMRQRRGWHDHVCGSLVVDVRPAPAAPPVQDEAPRDVVNLTAMRLVPPPRGETPTPLPVPPTWKSTPSPTRVRPQSTAWALRLDDGTRIPVAGLVLLGRRPEPGPGEEAAQLAPLTSSDLSVSKTHAQVDRTANGSVLVVDRGSTNGTEVVRQGDARRLVAGEAFTLVHGDTLVLGDRSLQLLREH